MAPDDLDVHAVPDLVRAFRDQHVARLDTLEDLRAGAEVQPNEARAARAEAGARFETDAAPTTGQVDIGLFRALVTALSRRGGMWDHPPTLFFTLATGVIIGPFGLKLFEENDNVRQYGHPPITPA